MRSMVRRMTEYTNNGRRIALRVTGKGSVQYGDGYALPTIQAPNSHRGNHDLQR